MKDLFGLQPTANEAELNAVGEELKEALFTSSENSEEVMERITEAEELLQELLMSSLMSSLFDSSSVTEEEVVGVAENITRVFLGLPEEATRDEIKATIASYLSKSKQ